MASHSLYPIKFTTIVKEKIWGGAHFKTLFNKSIDSDRCGELWEIADVNEDISVVADGPLSGKTIKQIIEEYQADLLGVNVFKKFGNKFPLLIKFIDANHDLSIQVHPNDKQAQRYNSVGKTEFWYVLAAKAGATLYSGFRSNSDLQEFKEAILTNSVTDLLIEDKVQDKDAYFIPAGHIHNIGEGLVIAEIQQSSDMTYRIHDFDRVDKDGKTRDLHLSEAMEVLNFESTSTGKVAYEKATNELVNLAQCEYFNINKIRFDQPIIRNVENIDSFIIYLCLEGKLDLLAAEHLVTLSKGDVYLVPAYFESLKLRPHEESLVLETYIP